MVTAPSTTILITFPVKGRRPRPIQALCQSLPPTTRSAGTNLLGRYHRHQKPEELGVAGGRVKEQRKQTLIHSAGVARAIFVYFDKGQRAAMATYGSFGVRLGGWGGELDIMDTYRRLEPRRCRDLTFARP